MRWPFGEVRSSIVTNLLEHDSYFVKNHNSPVMDWLKNDLTNHLNSSQITDSEFSGKRLERMAYRFRNMVEATPHDVNQAHLKDLLRTIDLERHVYPTSLYSQDVISHPIKDVRRFMIFNPFDLSSQGKIPIHKIPCMLQDPPAFKDIADIFDTIPLTDFNVDVIFSVDNQILFRHDHVALHRMAAFKDHNIGAFSTESLLSSLVNEDTLTAILKLFVQHHHLLDDDTRMILNTQPIKIKLMKTIEDEACVILFKYNSSSKDDPLCGVHFDIALQALAPITVMPAAIDF